MVFRYNKLRARVFEKYYTLSAFAQKLSEEKGKNVLVQYVSAKLTGSVNFTIDDICLWSRLLDIPQEEIGIYFFDYELSKAESEKIKGVTA